MGEPIDTAIGVLRAFATTKVQCDVFSDNVIESVQQGEANGLDVLIQIRAFQMSAERILKMIQPNILSEADKYPGTSFELYGNKLEKSEAGTKYDYAACGDVEWEQLNATAEQAIERRKEREAFLRAITKPLDVITEDGESATINPPTKTSTSIVKVSIK